MLIRFLFCFSVILYSYVNCRTYLVSNSRQFQTSLRVVNAGDTIQLRDGYYSGNFVASRFGRSNAPIRLIGSQRAIISNNGGIGLYLTGQYWWFRGFTVRNSRKGIVLQNARNNLLERLIVRDTEEEGIVVRQDSTDNTIRNCFVTRNGLRSPDFGFGISIGSDDRSSYRGYVDRSDRNSILNNRFQTGSAAEAIHIYEGTCCGSVRENYFDGRPLLSTNNNNNNVNNNLNNNLNNNNNFNNNYNNNNNFNNNYNANDIRFFNRCWAVINGNRYRIERNGGRNSGLDGFQVRMSQSFDSSGYGSNDYYNDGSGQLTNRPSNGAATRNSDDYDSYDDSYDIELQGCNNAFRGNRCELNTNGFCIRIINANRCRVIVNSDNTVVGNAAVTNVAFTNL